MACRRNCNRGPWLGRRMGSRRRVLCNKRRGEGMSGRHCWRTDGVERRELLGGIHFDLSAVDAQGAIWKQCTGRCTAFTPRLRWWDGQLSKRVESRPTCDHRSAFAVQLDEFSVGVKCNLTRRTHKPSGLPSPEFGMSSVAVPPGLCDTTHSVQAVTSATVQPFAWASQRQAQS